MRSLQVVTEEGASHSQPRGEPQQPRRDAEGAEGRGKNKTTIILFLHFLIAILRVPPRYSARSAADARLDLSLQTERQRARCHHPRSSKKRPARRSSAPSRNDPA